MKQTTAEQISSHTTWDDRAVSTLDVVDDTSYRRRRVRAFLRDLRGSAWLAVLRFRHREFVRDAEPVAAHLAEELLPTFRRHGQSRLALVIDAGGTAPRLIARGHHINFDMPAPARFVERLSQAMLTELTLDTRLGAAEIIESVLLAIHADTAASRDLPLDASEAARTWSARSVAQAVRSDVGFQGFSTRIRLDESSHTMDVCLSPRDLFGSRSIARWVLRRTAARDSLAMLRTSTKAGFLAFLIMTVPLLSFSWHSVAGSIVWLVCALTLSVWISVSVSTLGAVLYDRERRDQLLKNYLREIHALSDFAAANPKPLLKLAEDGEILYMNPATRHLLESMGVPEERAHEAIPGDIQRYIARALRGRNEEAETEVRDRILHYTFRGLPDERAVVVAGTDVTRMRKTQAELRALNEDLEAIVESRALETQEATVLCLARLAEIRDPETGAHLERTKRYVGLLARELATHETYRDVLDEEMIELMMKTAPLHDIGKVGVPDSILLKPARLTLEETTAMQRHPIYGGDALEWVSKRIGESRFFELAKEIAYHHHEKWDGSGYPFELAGTDIPLAARLMALADVYDALTSPRVYRPALPHDEVRDLILEERGRHFDPAIVDAFVTCEDAFRDIARIHEDDTPIETPIDATEDAAHARGSNASRDGAPPRAA